MTAFYELRLKRLSLSWKHRDVSEAAHLAAVRSVFPTAWRRVIVNQGSGCRFVRSISFFVAAVLFKDVKEVHTNSGP